MSEEESVERNVGLRIKEARERRQWSQARLAKEAGVSENTVMYAENGSKKTQASKVRAILEALGASWPSDTSLDLEGVPDDAATFLRIAAARLKVLDEPARASVLSHMYPHLLEEG